MDENATMTFFLWVFKFLPSYALSSGFGNLFAVAYNNAFCELLSQKDLEFNCDPNYQEYYNPILKCCKGNIYILFYLFTYGILSNY